MPEKTLKVSEKAMAMIKRAQELQPEYMQPLKKCRISVEQLLESNYMNQLMTDIGLWHLPGCSKAQKSQWIKRIRRGVKILGIEKRFPLRRVNLESLSELTVYLRDHPRRI